MSEDSTQNPPDTAAASYVIRPTKAYPFLMFTSSATALMFLFLFALSCAVLLWVQNPAMTIGPAKLIRAHMWVVYTLAGVSLLSMVLNYIYQHAQYTQIKYLFSPVGISFEAGLNFKGDFVSWKQINDVNMSASILQRLMKCGTIEVICTDYSVKQMLFVKDPKPLYDYMKDIIGKQLADARRIVRG